MSAEAVSRAAAVNEMEARAELLTPVGRGGIACLRVSGRGALARVRELVGGTLDERSSAPRFARFIVDGEGLDEGLVCVLGPQCVELHPHGSPPVVERLLQYFSGPGVPGVPGAPGALRAPSLETLAGEALAGAATEAAARVLLDQHEGAFRRALEELCDPRGRSEPDVSSDASRDASLDALLEAGRVTLALVRPKVVVLAGPTNAGKSTLFNALLGEERALVSQAAGTTRDVVGAPARFGAYPVRLLDTAGERELAQEGDASALESRGQALGRRVRQGADLVLWLSPADAENPEPCVAAGLVSVLVSRADLAAEGSAAAGSGVAALREPVRAREVVEALFHEQFELPREPWVPGRGAPFSDGQLELLQEARGLSGASRRECIERLLRQ